VTARQWAGLATGLGLVAAAIGGVVVSAHRSAIGRQKPAQAVSAPASPPAVSAIAPELPGTASDTVIQWVGCIAADSTTGALRSDLGWRACGKGSPALHLVYCRVGTMTRPAWKRVLVAPRGNILWLTSNPANYTMVDCWQAFRRWDSLETASGGRWPSP
jgi:hypothetical protein